jgi:hypothetical protein
MTSTRQSVSYGDAETRGRLRQWKKKLAQNYGIFDNAFKQLQGGKLSSLAVDMVKCSRSGRKQAFEKINKLLGPGITLEEVNLGRGNRSLAIWSILKPRDSVAMGALSDLPESERQSLLQDCVTVNYVLVGTSAVLVSEGLWTLEVPDHALGRAVERSRFLHPGTLIREAHLNLLGLPATILNQKNFTDHKSSGMYIKAGLGCFAGHFHLSEDVSIGNQHSAHVRVKTWLDENQLSERQIILSEKGEEGQRLGDSWLRPRPLCHFEQVGPNKWEVSVWQATSAPAARKRNHAH